MSRTRTRLGALVTSGVLTLGLTACADGETASDPTTPATTVDGAEGADRTGPADAGTGTADDTVATGTADDAAATDDAAGTAGPAEGEEIPVEEFLAMLQEPGEETLSRYTLTMDMQMDEEQSELEGAVDLSDDMPRMRITMTMPELGTVEVIYVEGEAYMAIPGLTAEGEYLIAPSELLGDAAELETIDVSTQLEVWEEGAQQVLYLGEDDVDGEQMRHYQVTLDPEAAAAAAGGDEAAATATAVGMDEPVVYDVWLDDDNLMRKLAFDVDGESVEMWLDNWGEDPGIEAPDPDQVTQMEDLNTDSR